MKSALDGTKVETIPLSRSDAARQLRAIAQEITLSLWSTSSSQTIRNSRQHHLPSLRHFRLPPKLSRAEATLLYRLWLRVAFTNSYSFLIGMADSPLCDTCRCEETLQHIICDCPRYDIQRQSLASALAHLDLRRMSVDVILECRPHRTLQLKVTKALLQFLKATDLHKRL